jgi:isochorismate hydrolase
VITCGVATSGCVRATVVDGFSYNRRMIVEEECTFDRGQATHWISLVDMDVKYANVVTLEQTLAHLDSLEAGLFDAQMPEQPARIAPAAVARWLVLAASWGE